MNAWNILCVLQMYFHSQKQMKTWQMTCYWRVGGVWRHVTLHAQRNDVRQPLTDCISGSNMPISILFVANCSLNLLDSYQAIKSILNALSILTDSVPLTDTTKTGNKNGSENLIRQENWT